MCTYHIVFLGVIIKTYFWNSLEMACEVLLMSNHNIHFHVEIRKMSIYLDSSLIWSYEQFRQFSMALQADVSLYWSGMSLHCLLF